MYIGITTSGFDIDFSIISGMCFYIDLPNFIQIGQPRWSYDVMSIFKMAAIQLQCYTQNGTKEIMLII